MNIINVCSDASLMIIFSAVKRIVLIIQIVVPVLLLTFGTLSFIKLVKNPETKNGLKKIYNQFIAAAIVFFLPIIVNAVMGLLGERTNISSCWNNASDKVIVDSNYYEINKNGRKKFINDVKGYEKGAVGDGRSIAELAVRVVPNAEPEARILAHTWLNWGRDRATVDSRMHDYIKIMDATTTKYLGDKNNPNHTITTGNYNNPAYCSCTQSVGAIVRATVDPDFNMSGDPTAYLTSHPEKWTMVGYIKVGEKFDDVCQPGDVLSVQRPPITTHVMLYVGHDLVKQRFPNSNANIYQGGYNAANESESWCPHLDYVDAVDARRQYFEIWRPTGNRESYYPFINIDEVLAGPLQTGPFW